MATDKRYAKAFDVTLHAAVFCDCGEQLDVRRVDYEHREREVCVTVTEHVCLPRSV